MVTLKNRVRNFREFHFPKLRQQFETLKYGQQPHTLFITCSDSQIIPHLLTDSEPGELVVVRNAGNIVPRSDSPDAGVVASIEFAVNKLKVPNIVVCGHSHCGAMEGLIDPCSTRDVPSVQRWLQNSQDILFALDDVPKPCQLDRAIKENVALQLSNLRTYPSVKTAEAQGELALHGWVFNFESGDVLELDESIGEFEPIVEESVFTRLADRDLTAS